MGTLNGRRHRGADAFLMALIGCLLGFGLSEGPGAARVRPSAGPGNGPIVGPGDGPDTDLSSAALNLMGRGLTRFPSDLPLGTVDVLLSFNSISRLSAASSPPAPAPRLRTLLLGSQTGPRGLSVERSAFLNAPGLRALDLGGNSGLRLEEEALEGLTELRSLSLDHCNLGDDVLAGPLLGPAASLERLDLSGNLLRHVRVGAWALRHFASSLRHLNLKRNHLEQICAGDLDNLSGARLQVLDLSSNRRLYDAAGFDWASCGNPLANVSVETLDISSTGMGSGRGDQLGGLVAFFGAVRGAAIRALVMRRMSGFGRSLGFRNFHDPGPGFFKPLGQSGLLSLDASHNRVVTLRASLFAGLRDLRVLDLSFNMIQEIEAGAFTGLQSLQELRLSHNALGFLSTDALSSLEGSRHSLRSLDLSRNFLGAVQGGALSLLGALTALNLSDNALSEVPVASLPRLASLALDRNRLRNAWGVERISAELALLNLSSNRVENVGELWRVARLPRLRVLSLARNPMSQCHPQGSAATTTTTTSVSSSSNSSLRILDLSHTPGLGVALSSSRGACDFPFRAMSSLRVLLLGHSGLSSLPNGFLEGLGALSHLNLAGNRLQRLSPGALQQLGSLETLDVSDNRLSAIGVATEPQAASALPARTKIRLGDNPFHCDCELLQDALGVGGDALQALLQGRGEGAPRCASPRRYEGQTVRTAMRHGNCTVAHHDALQ
ncbi:toll-like receptor 5 [Petromyzon marinus]|uniref:toll-like receptor 5 n=1 Tax=Petromyzon marinus TaxID=7757 RepID=UPI003F72B1EA